MYIKSFYGENKMNVLNVGINPYSSSVMYNQMSEVGEKLHLFVNKPLLWKEISIAEEQDLRGICLEFQNKIIKNKFETCKTFEADIVGLATSPATAAFGHLTLADGSKKFITRWGQEVGFGPTYHRFFMTKANSAKAYSRIEKVREPTHYEKKLSVYASLMKKNLCNHTDNWAWFDIARVVTGIVLASFVVLGNFFAASVTVGIGCIALPLFKYRDKLVTLRESEQNKKLESELAREVGYQAVLDAQEYYLQGPGPRADYVARQAFSYETKQPIRYWKVPGNDRLEEARRPMNESDLQRQLDFNQVMQTTFIRMKAEDPVKAARVVAKLFQGQFEDAEVIAYKEAVKPAYRLLCTQNAVADNEKIFREVGV